MTSDKNKKRVKIKFFTQTYEKSSLTTWTLYLLYEL